MESGGYSVIEARNGARALKKVEKHEGAIDLLVTDVVRPGMTGQELTGRLFHALAGETIQPLGASSRRS